MTDIIFAILLSIHVISAVSFLGGSIATVVVLSPAISKLSAVTSENILTRLLPRVTAYTATTAVATALAGILLYGYVGSVGVSRFPLGWGFIFFLLGAVLGLAGALTSFALASYVRRKTSVPPKIKPTSYASMPFSTHEVSSAKIDQSLKSGAIAVAVLLCLAITFMILAVNA